MHHLLDAYVLSNGYLPINILVRPLGLLALPLIMGFWTALTAVLFLGPVGLVCISTSTIKSCHITHVCDVEQIMG